MRSTLRQMVESGYLNAAGFPSAAKKPPVAGKSPIAPAQAKPPMAQGTTPAATKFPTGQPGAQGLAPELHIHLHPDAGDDNMNPSMQDPNDPNTMDPSEDPSEQDPSEMDPSDVDQTATEASPMAQNIAQAHVDPLGATKKTFGKLTKAKLQYDQAKEEAKRSVIPAMSVLQHVSNAHGLQPAIPGMDPNNPDQSMGYDPQTGQPQNMIQQPGSAQMNNPQNSRTAPGTSPAIPGGTPGNAATGAQTQVRPPKMGVPQPGQGNAGSRAGNPGTDAKKKGAAAGKGAAGKSVKVEVHGASEYRRGSRRLSKLEAAANLHNLRF